MTTMSERGTAQGSRNGTHDDFLADGDLWRKDGFDDRMAMESGTLGSTGGARSLGQAGAVLPRKDRLQVNYDVDRGVRRGGCLMNT